MTYYTWKGDEIKVTPYQVFSGRHGWTAYSVPRTVEMPDWLHEAFQEIQFADGWWKRSEYERNTWIHLYDAVLCGTVSFYEADDCISAGRVYAHLTARASNYMHTVGGKL